MDCVWCQGVNGLTDSFYFSVCFFRPKNGFIWILFLFFFFLNLHHYYSVYINVYKQYLFRFYLILLFNIINKQYILNLYFTTVYSYWIKQQCYILVYSLCIHFFFFIFSWFYCKLTIGYLVFYFILWIIHNKIKTNTIEV